jgi:peptide/nickel transport system permease protein
MTTLTTDIAAVTPSGPMATPQVKPARGRRRLRFLANGKSATGVALLAVFLLFAVIGPWITPYDPGKLSTDALLAPSGKHWFGTTHIGQDIFSQLLAGTRSVMYVGLLAGLVATALSIIIGVTAGYLGGTADEGLSALSNVFLVIPALPLIIIITSTVSSAGDTTVALVIGFTSWAWGARILRAQTLSLRRRDYVEAARATGESTWRIVFFEILPNLTAIIASGFVGTVIFAVTSEITLAFIGISSTSGWNWGTILYWAQSQQALAAGYWWWFIPPGLAIALLGTSLALINFGIDEFVSPRLRSSGKTKVKMANGHTVRMRFGFTPVLRQATDGQPVAPARDDTIEFGAVAPAPRSGDARPAAPTPARGEDGSR